MQIKERVQREEADKEGRMRRRWRERFDRSMVD